MNAAARNAMPTAAEIEAVESPRGPSRGRWKKPLLFAIKAAVSAGLIWWILTHAPVREVIDAVRGVRWPFLINAALLLPLGMVLGTMRWRALLRAHGVDIPQHKLYASSMTAMFFKQFLPGTIGGDAVRAIDTWRMGATKNVAVTAVAIDRVFGLLALAIFASAALVFGDLAADIHVIRVGAACGLVGLIVVIAWIFLPGPPPPAPVRRAWGMIPDKLRRPFDRILLALSAYAGEHGVLARSIVVALIIQFLVIVFYWQIGLALRLNVTHGVGLAEMMVIVPVGVVVMMVPFSINGIGVRESVWIYLLGLSGVPSTAAVAFGWIEFGLMLLFGLAGGVVYALRR
jgi:hypothetical protein